MATGLKKVILFEDRKPEREALIARLTKELPKGFAVRAFESDKPVEGTTYEKALVDRLQEKPYSGVGLVVSDSDLSATTNFAGLSEAVVSKAAARLGLPVCLYAAGMTDSVLERQKSGGDGRIVLDSTDAQAFAHRISVIAQGFHAVRTAIAKLKISSFHGPGALGATLLGRPEVAAQVSLYATGDQRMVSEFMPPKLLGSPDEPLASSTAHRATALGSWIYDSVLRFPGLLLSGDAAASYLNILPATFQEESRIQKLFDSALYCGPFSDSAAPAWWRDRIEDVLQAARVSDGRELVKSLLRKTVAPCLCSRDNKTRAGFYCVISRTPVSRENSQGNIRWLPRGADLSRVRRDLFDELEPWIGLQ